MPRVSQFFGVVIYMYHNDHLPSHFHAEYGEFEAVYAIDTLDILRGQLPRRAQPGRRMGAFAPRRVKG